MVGSCRVMKKSNVSQGVGLVAIDLCYPSYCPTCPTVYYYVSSFWSFTVAEWPVSPRLAKVLKSLLSSSATHPPEKVSMNVLRIKTNYGSTTMYYSREASIMHIISRVKVLYREKFGELIW